MTQSSLESVKIDGREATVFEPHFPDGLEAGVLYEFRCDDKGRDGGSWLRVLHSDDGDVHVSMQDWEDIREEGSRPTPFPSVRCRTGIGGGRHARTRQALLWLAQAIRLDNEELSKPAFLASLTPTQPAATRDGSSFPLQSSDAPLAVLDTPEDKPSAIKRIGDACYFNAKEIAVLEELAKQQDLTPAQVMRQALRAYQLVAVGHSRLVEVNPIGKASLTPVGEPDGGTVSEAAIREAVKEMFATVAKVQPTDGPIPDNIIRHYRHAAKQIGELFTWCLENLPTMRFATGDWMEQVKERLKSTPPPASSPADPTEPGLELPGLYWRNNSRDESRPWPDRFFSLENAYNHAVNAYVAARAVPAAEAEGLRREVAELNQLANQRWRELYAIKEAVKTPDKLFASQLECAAAEKVRELQAANAALKTEAREAYKALGLAAHDLTPAEMINTIAGLWGMDQEKITTAQARIEELRRATHGLLQCRDVSWDSGGGHDWKIAVEHAIEVLDAEQPQSSEREGKVGE